MKNKLLFLFIIYCMSSIQAYTIIEENFTFATAYYNEEHLKGNEYQIIFKSDYLIESNTYSEDISLGMNYKNNTHYIFEYKIYANVLGGDKTFSWKVVDTDQDVIELIYIDIHILLDKKDELFLQTQIEQKDQQIAGLKQTIYENNNTNVTLIYKDRTAIDTLKSELHASPNAIIFFIFIGSLVGLPSLFKALKFHKLTQSLDNIKNSVKMKSNFWEITFDILEQLVVSKKEGYHGSEVILDSIFQKEWIILASVFSPHPADWLTCLDEKIKKDERFKHIKFLDMNIEQRIERIRKWDRLLPIVNRYDIWAQIIRFALIPCCILFPEFWEEQLDPLMDLYKKYTEKSKEQNETTKIKKNKEVTTKPFLITSASDIIRGNTNAL